MAAAYETGTATDQNDLVQKLATWLAAQGWTENMNSADGAGWRLHMNKGAHYINIRAFDAAEATSNTWQQVDKSGFDGVALYLGNAYDGGSNWRSQGGGPDGGSIPLGANVLIENGLITAYHFFDDGEDNIVVVVEKAAGVFGAMGWGPSIEKAGAWTGGQYFFGQMPGYVMGRITTGNNTASSANGDPPFSQGTSVSYYLNQQAANAWVRADVDTFTGKWISNARYPTGAATYRGNTGWYGTTDVQGAYQTTDINVPAYTTFQEQTINPANGRGVMLPINFYAVRAAGYMSLLGRIPNLFISRRTYTPGSVVSVGGVDYMAFPAVYVAPGGSPTPLIDMTFMVRKLA